MQWKIIERNEGHRFPPAKNRVSAGGVSDLLNSFKGFGRRWSDKLSGRLVSNANNRMCFSRIWRFSRSETVFLRKLDLVFFGSLDLLVSLLDLDLVFRDSDWFLLRNLDLNFQRNIGSNFVFSGLWISSFKGCKKKKLTDIGFSVLVFFLSIGFKFLDGFSFGYCNDWYCINQLLTQKYGQIILQNRAVLTVFSATVNTTSIVKQRITH